MKPKNRSALLVTVATFLAVLRSPEVHAATIAYTYDAAGRLTRADYGDVRIDYTYDANGNLLCRTVREAGLGVRQAGVGVSFGTELPTAFAEAAKVTVAGVPAGLTYNKATRRIEGVPAKAGTFTVTVSAPGAETQTFQIVVEALPIWAAGTFNGTLLTQGFGPGSASLTVTPLGKISGKLLFAGQTYVLTATSYREVGVTGEYRFEAVAKAGKTGFATAFSILPPRPDSDLPSSLSKCEAVFAEPVAGTAVLYRDVWRDAGLAAMQSSYVGYYTAALSGFDGKHGTGYLTLTVDAVGSVKTAGKLADGVAVVYTGPLVLDWGGRVWTSAYLAPKAYAGGVFQGSIEFVNRPAPAKPYLRLLEGAEGPETLLWQSRSPTASDVPAEGFLRELEVLGGWYDRSADLRSLYVDGLILGDVLLPALQTTVKVTDWDNSGTKKVSWTETQEVTAQAEATPAGLTLTVNAAGNGFVVPLIDKATLVNKASGVYDYAVDSDGDGQINTAGLTFKFTPLTGLFTGTFKAWYDYAAAADLTTGKQALKHASATLKYEGALVPGRQDPTDGLPARGFFLMPEKATPAVPAKPYTFNRSYEFWLQNSP